MKDCCISGAASYSALPGCAALIEHIPGAMKLTAEPSSEHTEGVVEENDTASPEEAVADTA